MKWFAIFCALCVAFCWGMYGPTLTNARSLNREWGPFKPYLFIGVAYLVIAIAGGALMMKFAYNDSFDYSGKYFPAMKWGFLAGCLGALGALGLTFALTKAGGKPSYVMPIVFGGAVTVNAIAAYFSLHPGDKTSPLMWLGMALVVVGICLTAGYTPHSSPPAKPADPNAAPSVTEKVSSVDAPARPGKSVRDS
jgi:drug/metabolite transporter (DMT)-like permease